eukprot:TRINITY_DN68181_c3_g1_i1.p1 TRINITY_DN68181_c3_g1~~TRINITY_DN68181_c3_g1_i1.p1  ORF type:complete len:408 (-),score=44.41 TRINITY_DN68181_c3_g1_i1:365-1588(-)
MPKGSASTVWPFMTYWANRGGPDSSVAFAEGIEWRKIRSILQTSFFGPKDAEAYIENMDLTLNQVTKALTERGDYWGHNMSDFGSRLGMEMIGNVMFNINLGALTDNCSAEENEYLSCTLEAMRVAAPLTLGAPWRKSFPKYSKLYRTFSNNMDVSMARSKVLIDRVLEGLAEAAKTGEENWACKSYLGRLLTKHEGGISKEEICNNVGTLYFAGVDTTSNTIQWLWYNLARFPEVQEKLAAELHEVLGGANPKPGDFAKLPYLSACVKESFRLTPTAGGMARWVQEDTTLLGYHIPKGTQVNFLNVGGRDPKFVNEPEEFRPERWLNAEESAKLHKFWSHNFGFGPRMCLGARVAAIEVKAATSRVIQDFQMKLDPPDQKVEREMRLLTCPNPVPKFQFVRRSNVN